MTVICPFTIIDPRTAQLLDEHAPGHRRVYVGQTTESYWELLAAEWQKPGDLILVEQDNALRADVIPSFDACDGVWCGFPYPIGEQLLVCLGMTRFREELKLAEPDLLEVVGLDGTGGLRPKMWQRLDIRLMEELHHRGYSAHEHLPATEHFHKY